MTMRSHRVMATDQPAAERRRFNGTERQVLFLATQGLCASCGDELVKGFHADHVRPYAEGGATDVLNGQALCPTCNLKKGSRMSGIRPWTTELRVWQEKAFEEYSRDERSNFLLVATPGSGKTIATLRVAHFLLQEGIVERLVVVVPSSHLRLQWTEAAHSVGINLDPTFENGHGRETRDFHGIAVTYQAVASSPLVQRTNCSRRTLVILDEIHHAGDECGWGEALQIAFGQATRRLCLSGTPFRSDSNRIPFVHYEDGRSVSTAPHGFCYGYDAALKDPGVIRAILFPHYEGNMEWIGDGFECAASFGDKLDEQNAARRLRTALMPTGEWLRNILQEANEKLHEVRTNGHPDAAGLVLAMDQNHARRIADVMKDLSREASPAASLLADVLVVTSDDPAASDRIAGFRSDTRPWVVAVRMISEGVDIRRLRIGVYASNIVTELFFRQVVGRFVRWLNGLTEQTAYLYIPADERLVGFAREVQQERDHFIEEAAKLDRVERSEDGDGPPVAGFFMPVDASGSNPVGIVHESLVLPQKEISEAREILRELVGSVPDHALVLAVRRVRERIGAVSAPVPQTASTQPAQAEQMRYRARDTAKGVRNERVRSFVGMILKAGGRAGIGYRDVVTLVNRKLAEYSGWTYADQLTSDQLQAQQQILLQWLQQFGEAARNGRAPMWLDRWEGGSL